MHITIRPAQLSDLPLVEQLSRDTFAATFAADNSPDDLAAYMGVAFSTHQLQEELATPGTFFYLAYCDAAPAGYLKLNAGATQTEFRQPDGLEVERIYVLDRFQRYGVGSRLLERALQTAQKRQEITHIWLGVWERNTKALAFYARHGFYPIGSHIFQLGSDPQTDLLLRKDLVLADNC